MCVLNVNITATTIDNRSFDVLTVSLSIKCLQMIRLRDKFASASIGHFYYGVILLQLQESFSFYLFYAI